MFRARILPALRGLGLIGLALACGLTAALAQSQQQPPALFGPRANAKPGAAQAAPPAQILGTFGDWKLTCETVSEPDPANPDAEPKSVKSCGLVQITRNEERKNIGLSIVLIRTKQDGKESTMVRVMAPIGVFLPMGVALEIDGNAISRVPFTRCAPQTCMAMAAASPETLDKLKKGKEATFFIYNSPTSSLPMKISLKGISEALAALDKQIAAQ